MSLQFAPRPLSLVAVLATLLGALAPALLAAESPAPRIDFDRDVRPILAENCYACHGPDEKARQAGLRLDVREGAYQVLKSGKRAVAPGSPRESELLRRVAATNGLRMPPSSSGKSLTSAQVATLRRWVEQGGAYGQHWAFVKPARPPLPEIKLRSWPVNPIDRFVLARLEQEGLRPSPPADRRTLIRRLTFDLTGLPPTPAEVSAFENDTRPGAYERVVDRLLASPHYGERQALAWLDLSRYADTHGYHIDSQRDMWPWRDWVIRAFNENKPYDRFVVEQIAGDLLPNATLDQKVATGFNRNHPINFEGGAIPEEYQAAYIFDRIDTTATAFLGLTMRCSQCHDHKYDPLTQKDFYRFYAFFNNIKENGLDGQKGNAAPFMKVPTPEQQAQLVAYDRQIVELDGRLKTRAAQAAPAQAAWEQTLLADESAAALRDSLIAYYPLDEAAGDVANDRTGTQPAGRIRRDAGWKPGKFGGALAFDGLTSIGLGEGIAWDRQDRFSYGAWIYPTTGDGMAVLSRMDDAAANRGWDLYLGGGKVFAHLIHEWEGNAIRVNTKEALSLNQWHHVFVTYDGSSKAAGLRIYVDGKPSLLEVTHDRLSDSIRVSLPAVIGRRRNSAQFKGLVDEVRFYSRELSAQEVSQLAGAAPVRDLVMVPREKRTPEQRATVTSYYLGSVDGEYQTLNAELADLRQKRTKLDESIPTSMVMEELPSPRDTFVLIRGQYDKKGEKVTPATPAVLPSMPPGAPASRLGLAQWLVSPENPLTARVAVNHFWQMLFGNGLVRTVENFGTQGERPTHPELLDWLAVTFSQPSSSDGNDGEKERGRDRATDGPGGLGWDIKKLVRLIVTSATYRQTSALPKSPQSAESANPPRPNPQSRVPSGRRNPQSLDPENRLLARAPRYRLPAEMVRDQALRVSGLLVEKLGGPSVRPYQPPGLWEELAFGGGFSAQTYQQDHGEALYRRSMYTFWKRTCPPPALQTFDAPEREVCMVRRTVTNTPLQALVLMNDVTYTEASRKLAERIMTEVSATPRDRIGYAYRLTLARAPKPEELRVLLDVFADRKAAFEKDRAAAEKLLAVGESKRNEQLDVPELAAWTTLASVILNLDEMITKN